VNWADPAYLWLGLLALPLAFLAARGARRRRRDLTALAGADGEVAAIRHAAPRARVAGRVLLTAAGLLLIIALCGPQWGAVAEERQSQGVDILIALDTSRSMLADDLAPSRLLAAKEAIAALTAQLRGDRIGLIAYAGSAFLVCPLTTDYGVFGSVLAQAGVDTIPLGGSSLSAPLKEAKRAFAGQAGEGRVLILVGDGEDHGEDHGAAAGELKECGVTVYTVAAGTPQGGLIPLPQGEFLKDGAGLVVKSRADRDRLRGIAAASGGRLLDLSAGPSALVDLYRQDLCSLERKAFRSSRQRLRERFQIPLALALVLLFVEPCLGKRGKG